LLLGLLVAMLLAACSNQMEPARRSLGELQAAIDAASADAAMVAPDQLSAVQTRFGLLESAFDKQDYAAVVNGAPAVLRAAQELIGTAAAARAERRRSLGDEWSGLAAVVPGRIDAVQHRIDLLAGRRTGRRAGAAGVRETGADLGAARSRLGAAESSWSKAQAAFATGNLDEAATAARGAATQLDAAAAGLQLTFAVPAT
jgi:hypothetical protein